MGKNGLTVSMTSIIIASDSSIPGADLVITGESRYESQTSSGKVVHGVTELARKQSIPLSKAL
mgnify:CR=1 FL=1